MEWTLIPVRRSDPTAPRQALLYVVKHGRFTYRVMLGINERGTCELLEHHVHEVTALRIYPYRLLPYIRERYSRGEGPEEFATKEEAISHVEHQIHLWEASKDSP
jgi:hypothetical protein